MSKNNNENPSKNHFIHSILNPKSICVFGANNNLLTTMGAMQLRNIIAGGFPKENIFPVHPKLDDVQGIKAYKNVLDLPETPDFAFLILPTKAVPSVMEECGEKGIKKLLITSGGFRESGPDGIMLSQKINEIAKKYGMRFIGPNCLGIYNAWYRYPEKQEARFNTFWVYILPERGNISIASQSGTIAAQTAWHSKDMGLRIGKSISVGNENNIDLVDFLEYFKEDSYTSVIGLYIEEIKRGKKFIKLAKEITPKKPIVAIYAGGSEAVTRSIMSHTGSIAGNSRIYDAVFKEAGIISTNSIMDFLYYLRTLSHAQSYNVFPKGNRVGIITDSGGSGSMMTKMLELYGLKVPEFSKELQLEIRKDIPSTASANNPIDVTFDINIFNLFYKFPKILMESGEVDAIIVYGVFDFEEVLDIIEKSGMPIDEQMKSFSEMMDRGVLRPIKRLMHKFSIPVYYSGPYPLRYSWYQKFATADIPIFTMWDFPTKCLKILRDYTIFREKFS